MGDNIIKIELTQIEVNLVLFARAEQPYKKVYEVVRKIQEQGNAQL